MKRYWLFSGEDLYPLGGLQDFSGCFNSVDEAVAAAKSLAESNFHDWWHVFDSVDQRIVKDKIGVVKDWQTEFESAIHGDY